jgi:hypothetical protein
LVAVSCGAGEIAENKLVRMIGLRIDGGEEVGDGLVLVEGDFLGLICSFGLEYFFEVLSPFLLGELLSYLLKTVLAHLAFYIGKDKFGTFINLRL